MSNKIKVIILFTCSLIIILYTVFSERLGDNNKKDVSFEDYISSQPEEIKNNYFTINEICDCYTIAYDLLDNAIDIRDNYETFEAFSKNKESVNTVNDFKTKFQKLQLQCVETYKREMFNDRPCGSQDKIMNKRNQLNQMGIRI
jgi:hypothetical protein|tara:strand:+ start:1852 stop:2283 length:432 start_codon:yes stop_codon:yes gene_type:complete